MLARESSRSRMTSIFEPNVDVLFAPPALSNGDECIGSDLTLRGDE